MSNAKKIGSITALLASGLVAGGVLAGSMTANAADSSTTTTTPSSSYSAPANPNPGDSSKPQRADETLLTGSTADKVKAAAMAKYPNGTIIRLETDSDGVYEAHMTVNGSEVIVQVGSDFTVTGTQTMAAGHGAPPPASTTQG
jgi:hypothetical protein